MKTLELLSEEYENVKSSIINEKEFLSKPFGNANPRKGLLGCCVASEAIDLLCKKYGKIFGEAFNALISDDYKLSVKDKSKAEKFFEMF